MLVGPSITLEKLEEHMADKLYQNKMELPKLQKEFNQLREDFKRIPRTVYETKEGKEVEVVNPDFTKIPDQMKVVEARIKEIQEQQEFMEGKLEELETIEDRALKTGVKLNKADHKITLTLNDCVALGIELEEAPTE